MIRRVTDRFCTAASTGYFVNVLGVVILSVSLTPTRVQAEVTQNGQSSLAKQQRRAEQIRTAEPDVAVVGYTDQSLSGWPLRVSNQLRADRPRQTAIAIELLQKQLDELTKILPPKVVQRLRCVPLWISPKYPNKRPGAEYHPGARWLAGQRRHPELLECVEFSNVSIFPAECKRMPAMALHELAHAFHHQVLGFDHSQINATYEAAKSAGIYDAVERHNGKIEKAYAITNAREYFAETSEAYFSRNDFFPFDSKQLKEHDRRMHDLLGQLWKVE